MSTISKLSGQLLSITDLSVSINGKGILNEIKLSIGTGERVGVIGRSGSGKSTLAWTLMGARPNGCELSGDAQFTSGTGHVDMLTLDESLSVLGTEVSIIPQNPFTSLNPSIKCGIQVLESVRHVNGDGKARVIEMFESLGLDESERIYDSWPHQLSGGQLQRVVIAMALIGNPALLVADEATTALDPATSNWVLNTIDVYCRDNEAALLMISHEAHVIGQMCQSFYKMEDGSLSRIDRPVIQNMKIVASQSDKRGRIFALKDVGKTFSDSHSHVKALDGVSFVINKGRSLGIAGQSGSGKSTIAKILTGLESIDSGTMLHNDQTYLPRSKEARKSVQMIIQDPYSSLYPHRSAGYCISEALEVHSSLSKDTRDNRIAELLDEVGLSADYAQRSTRTLSGGERQRIQIARALAVEPEILICDECTNGLDPEVQARILGLLHKLKQSKGVSIVFISHDIRALATIADDILILSEGQVVEEGPASKVLRSPQHEVTRKLVSVLELSTK